MSEQKEILKHALNSTLGNCDFPALGKKIKGKVRDCYVIGDKRVLISSDRLSAFDVVLTTIPFKGKILNDLSMFWFEKTKHIIKNHIISRPHPNVFIGQEVKILPIEVVVRGYLTGSAFRDYESGKSISGIQLKKGLKKHQKFDTPILTPATKAEHGEHDLPISQSEIISKNIVSAEIWNQVESIAFKLFDFASQEVAKRGLILVDTKFEFGIKSNLDGTNEIILADEIFTQDCSRYWIADSYKERFLNNKDPEMLDKEYIRRWLIQEGYMGEGTPPQFSEDFRIEIAERYIEVYEMISGIKFNTTYKPIDENIIQEILKICS